MPNLKYSDLSIQTARSAQDLENFINFPWKIYKGDPLWVPPLKEEVREILTEKNPFWRHAEKELFLAKQDGDFLGRVAAVVDENHNEFHGESCGFFGFFECVNSADVAKLLIESAGKWLRSKGMTLMRGPENPSTNEECGLLIDGFGDPPAIMMPYNPRYYGTLLETVGLKKTKDLYSYFFDTQNPLPERVSSLIDRIRRKRNVQIRPLCKRNLEGDLRTVKEIYNDAWEKNWGFVPMTDAEFDRMIVKLKPILVPEAVHFAEVGGETVAFSIILPDVNQVLKKLNGNLGVWGTMKFLYYFRKISRMRLIALGVKKNFRNRGLEALLYNEAWLLCRRKGWTADLGWILEDNENMKRGVEALNCRLYKKYRIYEQDISRCS